jgi:hypothetical protein
VQARQWKVRPSEMLGLEDPYTAYCLDEAVLDLVSYIEEELESVKVKGSKPEVLAVRKAAKLEALLTGDVTKQFANPMAKVKT